MKDIEKVFPNNARFDLSLLDPDPEKLLFFDIETTGLSAHSSSLYLIGMLYFRDGETVFRQLFAEDMTEELEVLRVFFAFTKQFRTLVHFNGDTFDIPYLETCAAQYSLACPLRDLRSVDILKLVRKRRKLLGLQNCRLKSVERFLGIYREDVYDGGELISVYQAYEQDRDPRKERLLLLHNEEDVLDMPSLLPVLTYSLALSSVFSEEDRDLNFTIEENVLSRSGETRRFRISFPFAFPREIRYVSEDGVSLRFSGNLLDLSLPQYAGELRYFYPNYRDYFYLPREDRAVHKKLAVFVEKPYKVPASPDTCYTKMEGFFLPAIPGSDLPVFSENRRDRKKWHLVSDEEEFFESYVRAFLKSI